VVVVPAAPAPAPSGGVEIMSLRIMLDKGIISKGEYESALRDLTETGGLHTPMENSVVMGKWATTLYGFVESDYIWDTTQAFNDLAGAAQVPRGGTVTGDNGRFQFSVRNSRVGLRLKAPEVGEVKPSAVAEFDFLGTQLPIANPSPAESPVNAAGTEGAFYSNAVLRIRHMYLKVETPIVDVLAGQYWSLFGWGPAYQLNTVQIQGVPGEVYFRTPQLRISKKIGMDPVSLELAVAAQRPVQRDSAVPDGVAALKFAVESWRGMQTTGSTGTQLAPFSLAVGGLFRRVSVAAFSATPKTTNDLGMDALVVDGFLPVLPATKEHKDNALSVQGEFSTGYGMADQFTGLTGGISFPTLPNPMMVSPAPVYSADIDNGIVTYDTAGHLHGIQWTMWNVGAQYYFPGCEGKFWVSGNYSHGSSANTHYYGSPAKLRAAEDWFDVNLFVDPIPSIRVGAEFAEFIDVYVDGEHALNRRLQLSGFFIY
jgi:hypothetical protein